MAHNRLLQLRQAHFGKPIKIDRMYGNTAAVDRAKRSEDDIEIYIVNYFSTLIRNTGQFTPHADFGIAARDSDCTKVEDPSRFSPLGRIPPTGPGPKWSRGTIVVGAEATSVLWPQDGVFEILGGHELSHVLADMAHKTGEFSRANLLCDGKQAVPARRQEHPLGDLRLDREQETRMRSHRALK